MPNNAIIRLSSERATNDPFCREKGDGSNIPEIALHVWGVLDGCANVVTLPGAAGSPHLRLGIQVLWRRPNAGMALRCCGSIHAILAPVRGCHTFGNLFA